MSESVHLPGAAMQPPKEKKAVEKPESREQLIPLIKCIAEASKATYKKRRTAR
jgi:hypothetical protein